MNSWVLRLPMVAFLLLVPFAVIAQGQNPSSNPPATTSDQPLKPEEIAALVAPIALYPDNLLAEVLMASTYPLEVVQADRWAAANKRQLLAEVVEGRASPKGNSRQAAVVRTLSRVALLVRPRPAADPPFGSKTTQDRGGTPWGHVGTADDGPHFATIGDPCGPRAAPCGPSS
jgi:hypothetical protein